MREALQRSTVELAAVVSSASAVLDDVAFVRQRRAVIDLYSAAAVFATTAQAGVKRIEDLGVDPANLQHSQLRADVLVDVAHVADAGRLIDVENIEVTVHKLVDRRSRTRAALLVDLIEQPGPHLLGLCGCFGPGGTTSTR
jgi:hypothetical protein